MSLTDTAFLGHLGEVELGGSAIAGLIYVCLLTIGFGLAAGTQIIVARRYGAKEYDRIGGVLIQSGYLLLTLVLGLMLLFQTAGRATFEFIISSPHILDAAVEYWNYRIWGLLFSFAGMIFRSFYVGVAHTKVLTYKSVIMAVANIFLDYGLIFGHFGLPAMGIQGAALASVLAEMLSLLFILVYTLLRSTSRSMESRGISSVASTFG